MSRAGRLRKLFLLGWLVVTSGCAAQSPYNYDLFQAYEPSSILVLPPLNESVDINADYSWLSTATRPLAEQGYYVFPVAIVDSYMKENGLPSPAEMHAVPTLRLAEVFGADAILYVTILDWGQKFRLFSSDTVVQVAARLVDADTGTQLWDGSIRAVQPSGGGGDPLAELIGALIIQAIMAKTDEAHGLASRANHAMFRNTRNGIPAGRRSPDYFRNQPPQ